MALDNIKAQIIKHYQRISDREAYVTAEMVRNAYQGIGTEYETLLGAFDKDNESFKKRIGIDRADGSYKVRVRSRNHLATFIKKCYKRSDISMLELTPDFIKEYEIYLSTDAGLHNGSVWSHCMWLKTISESGKVNISSINVWMFEMELVELFMVIAPTLRAAIKAIYKSGALCPTTTQRCDLATPKSWATFYNLEVVIALAFRLNTYKQTG